MNNRILYFACAAGGVTLGLAGLLLYSTLSRDRWEPFHIVDCLRQLEKADKMREADPLEAYRVYEAVIAEAAPHEIVDAEFKQRLLSAANAKDSLYPIVEQAIRKQEAEKTRALEEKRRNAEEKIREVAAAVRARRAAGEERRRKEADAKKLEARIRERTTCYATLPPVAREALNALKKIEARVEVGINYQHYTDVVGEANRHRALLSGRGAAASRALGEVSRSGS